MLEQKIYLASLLDLYGAMLTDKQRECMRLQLDEDFSLAEIGSELGISRQAVHDNITRSEQSLLNFEQKLGFYQKSHAIKAELSAIRQILDSKGHKNTNLIDNIVTIENILDLR